MSNVVELTADKIRELCCKAWSDGFNACWWDEGKRVSPNEEAPPETFDEWWEQNGCSDWQSEDNREEGENG